MDQYVTRLQKLAATCMQAGNQADNTPNDPVYMQAGNRWIPATVIQKANTPHSYIIKTTEGHSYRRNRRHLKTS